MTTRAEKVAELRMLQGRADAIRKDLGISPPGAVLYQSWLNSADEEMVVVEADGLGRATTRVVEGNYPLDYLVISERVFESEISAQDAADAIVEGTLSLDPA
jgi:hypothetical protein